MFVSVVGLMAATLDCLTLLRLSPRDIHHYRETFSDGQTDFLNNPFNDCFVGLCCDTHLCFSHALPGVLLWRESIWQLTISIDFLGFIIREVTDDRRWHRFQDTVTSRRDLFLIRRKTWSKWWVGSKQPVTPHSPTIPLAWLTPGCRFDYEPSSPLWLRAAFFLADIVPFFGVSFPSPSLVYPVPFCLSHLSVKVKRSSSSDRVSGQIRIWAFVPCHISLCIWLISRVKGSAPFDWMTEMI